MDVNAVVKEQARKIYEERQRLGRSGAPAADWQKAREELGIADYKVARLARILTWNRENDGRPGNERGDWLEAERLLLFKKQPRVSRAFAVSSE